MIVIAGSNWYGLPLQTIIWTTSMLAVLKKPAGILMTLILTQRDLPHAVECVTCFLWSIVDTEGVQA